MDTNAINIRMRQQPWYQQWFQAQRLDPNRVKLSGAQRQALAHVAAQNGMPLGDGQIIDPAGNVNTHHGFAGQPTWLKALEIGGAAAAGGYFAAPALFGAAAPSVAPAVATSAAPVAGAGVGAGTAATTAASGFGFGKALTALAPQLINTGTQLVGAKMGANANNHAADVQAQAARDALEYTKTHDATQRQDFLDTQNRNFGLYQEAQARLDPYRAYGLRSLAQMGRAIPGVGSLASRM